MVATRKATARKRAEGTEGQGRTNHTKCLASALVVDFVLQWRRPWGGDSRTLSAPRPSLAGYACATASAGSILVLPHFAGALTKPMTFALSKTQAPRFRSGLIERHALEARLGEALLGYPLVLLVGAAGFGRTAALARQLSLLLPPDCAKVWGDDGCGRRSASLPVVLFRCPRAI